MISYIITTYNREEISKSDYEKSYLQGKNTLGYCEEEAKDRSMNEKETVWINKHELKIVKTFATAMTTKAGDLSCTCKAEGCEVPKREGMSTVFCLFHHGLNKGLKATLNESYHVDKPQNVDKETKKFLIERLGFVVYGGSSVVTEKMIQEVEDVCHEIGWGDTFEKLDEGYTSQSQSYAEQMLRELVKV